VNLNLPIKSETKAETTEVLKLVDEDRKYVSQATIVRCVFSEACCRLAVVPEKTSLLFFFFFVRIMKARKTMKNQALIQEVITQLSPKFTPRIPDIKKVEYKLGVLGFTDSYHIIFSRPLRP